MRIRFARDVKEVAGVEAVGAIVNVTVAVIIVGPVLGSDGDDGASVAAILSVEVACDNAKFLRRVNVRRGDASGNSRDIGIVIVDTIDEKIVVPFAFNSRSPL